MAEYIDRNLIEWYGCDFEDGSCDHKECSECSQAECLHTQVMQIPTANVIPIPEGATNGDMIKAMFPNDLWLQLYARRTKKDWWNAPYKKEVEE